LAAQAESVKALKKLHGGKKDDPEVMAGVAKLQALKAAISEREQGDPEEIARLAQLRAEKEAEVAVRNEVEMLLRHRGFVFPSNEIHNGPAGFFDFGPVGCAMKQNLLQYWRQHFVLRDNMLEIETPAMTPAVVFKTSGHVERFSDFMVTDLKDDSHYRADKLLEEYCEQALADPSKPLSSEERADLERIHRDAGAMDAAQLKECFQKYTIKSPLGNDLSDPFPFNLMFMSQIGPSGKSVGYLRPETAQGMFVNFRRLLEFNNGKMPFAAAQIGPAFRNEIAPRQGLLRVREFTLAEIEHFVNPNDKRHANFDEIADVELLLLPRENQERGEMEAVKIKASVAVKEGIINNETLAYYMARSQQFLLNCGIIESKLRFRQHKKTEMAHYSSDCWDAEVLSSYGWIECIGHADRAAYDLDVHTKVSGADLSAQEIFEKPREVQVVKWDIKNAIVGKTFGKKGQQITEYVRSLALKEALDLESRLASSGSATIRLCSGEEFPLTREMMSASVKNELQHTAKYTPNVIEPAFGIGRIFYSILEHVFYVRPQTGAAAAASSSTPTPAPADDGKKGKKSNKSKDKSSEADKDRRAVLRLPAHLAPLKLSILPLSAHAEFEPVQRELARQAIQHNLTFKVDASSGSIGKRYARADEIGVPYGITIDFESKTDGRVTIRERDSMDQIRVPINEAIPLLAQLVQGMTTWKQAYDTHDKFTATQQE